MAIIWLIIKIILFVLLGIIGLVLLLLLGVVFLPITYQAKFVKLNDTRITVRSKLFKIIGAEYIQDEDQQRIKIDLWGIRLFQKNLKEDDSEVFGDQKVNSVAQEDIAAHTRKSDLENPVSTAREDDAKDLKQATQNQLALPRDYNKKVKSKPETEVPLSQKIKLKSKTKSKIKKSKTKKSKQPKKKNDFLKTAKELWHSEHRQGAIHAVKKAVGNILKTLRPKSLNFNITIGKEEPSDTGQLIAKLALLYPFYHRYGIINGNYEEEGFWGRIEVYGKFNLYHIIKPIIILVFNADVKAYIKIILKSRKDD